MRQEVSDEGKAAGSQLTHRRGRVVRIELPGRGRRRGRELEEEDEEEDEVRELERRIEKAQLPEHALKAAQKELKVCTHSESNVHRWLLTVYLV